MVPGDGVEPPLSVYVTDACIHWGYTVARKGLSGITVLLTRHNLLGEVSRQPFRVTSRNRTGLIRVRAEHFAIKVYDL